MYRQCLLERGTTKQVAFIPLAFARVGSYVRLRGVDGWRVIAAWSIQTAENLTFNERNRRAAFGSLA